MCGLCGIAFADGGEGGRRDAEVARALERMTPTLVHRGPDDEGHFVRGGAGLGFRRLSIIDLAGGHQPLFDESGEIALVCNGEIYNYRELREGLLARGHRPRTSSDVETIAHLYEEQGALAARELVGMFAFALLDFRGRAAGAAPRVVLGRDPIGVKPLYWAFSGQALAWGSEAKAVLASGLVPRRLRAEALLDYLVSGYVPGPGSAWEGIEKLPPGCVLVWEPGERPRVERYWDLPTDGLRGPVEPGEVLEWVDRVVRSELVSEVPLGAFLSGGIDSTAVVTSMALASPEPVVACSVGFAERAFDELERARASAARLGLAHHTRVLEPDPALAIEVLPWHFDEPLADPSTVPTWLVSKMAREHVTVALSGDGGDEVFGGYRRYVFDVAENRARRVLGPATRLAGALGRVYPKLDWAPRPLRAKSTLLGLAEDPARAYWRSLTQHGRAAMLALLEPELAARLAAHDSFDAFREHYERPRGVDSLYRAQYADFHGFLPDQILTKTDRASMAVSLEVRVPLLDHRFVARFANLPAAQKVRAGRGKHALREGLRGRVPDEVLDGPKKGFDVPLAAWLRGPLAAAVGEALESLPAEWFRRERLRAALAEHRSGRFDRSHLLWSLLVLEHWRRRHGVTGIAA